MAATPTLVSAGLSAALATLLLAGGNLVYSNPGGVVPTAPGLHINVQPSPVNIWRLHETVTATANAVTTVPVFIDMDGDGVSDTLDPNRRVLITDFLVSQDNVSLGWQSMGPFRLMAQCPGVAAPVPLWEFGPPVNPAAGNHVQLPHSEHLSTPIAVPPGAALTLEVSNLYQGNATLEIYMNGRESIM